MEWFSQITVGEVILSFLTCCLIHEALVIVLPDEIAGPGGWLIDTRD
ncbi:hypothetical protein [Aliiruegeria lutimaris]|uniref:Uncharacterized protein n=1 Tax=Aliiruegeria lutimaris TaxID=571298 RepID=A0A1G9BWN4_9RHOB|nr:hypothetical protein [Aliiruegeria lutimaris]SDK43856.1 hypothetical protein SAMN04488026_104111 [Aliiruegeria lutimaris]